MVRDQTTLTRFFVGPSTLVCNAMLPILAILVAIKAFRDYDTLEDLLAIQASEGEWFTCSGRRVPLICPSLRACPHGAPRRR